MSVASGWYGFGSSADGGGLWSNRGAARYDNSSYASDVLSPGYYSWFKLYSWGGPTISESATIDSIDVRCKGMVLTSSSYDQTTDALRLRVAFNYSGSTLYNYYQFPSSPPPYVNEGSAVTYEKTGRTLSNWGISEAEAFDIINGSEPYCVGAVNPSSHTDSETFRIYYAEMQVNYTPPPGNAGMLIGNPGA